MMLTITALGSVFGGVVESSKTSESSQKLTTETFKNPLPVT
jgi:hypothetical protein